MDAGTVPGSNGGIAALTTPPGLEFFAGQGVGLGVFAGPSAAQDAGLGVIAGPSAGQALALVGNDAPQHPSLASVQRPVILKPDDTATRGRVGHKTAHSALNAQRARLRHVNAERALRNEEPLDSSGRI